MTSSSVIESRRALRYLSSRHLLFFLVCLFSTAAVLTMMGRSWWCHLGDWGLWAGGVNSPHNSQHVADPYTFTHILHGVGFYALIWLFLRSRLDEGVRFMLAIFLESAWEILENTDPIIERFREDTVALGYFGDSIINSMVDIVACAAGYLLAAGIPVIGSILFFFFIELLLIYWIRDSLVLNILMLLWPLERIREWQMELGSAIGWVSRRASPQAGESGDATKVQMEPAKPNFLRRQFPTAAAELDSSTTSPASRV